MNVIKSYIVTNAAASQGGGSGGGLPIDIEPFTSVLTFDEDKDFEIDTGGTISFTLSSSGNLNGAGIIALVNKPVSVAFSSDFEIASGSDSISTTLMNIIIFRFFENYDGEGNDKVIYTIKNQLAVEATPSIQATNIVFSNVTPTSFDVSFTNGNGANRIVLIKSGSEVDSNPVNNTTYTANAAFGSGSQIGTGNYVVYKGSGSSVSVTGLSLLTTYHVRVYEFNGATGAEKFFTDAATGNPASQTTSAYETEYQAILDRGTTLGYTLPSVAQRTKQNTLVASLKSSGVWTALDVFWVFATDGDSNFSTINWKAPTLFQCTPVFSPTHTTNAGWAGNASTSYLNTGWDASNNGVNYLLNTCSYGCYVNSNNNDAGNDMGANSAGFTNSMSLSTRNGSNNLGVRINDATTGTITNSSSIGFYIVQRSASNARQVLKNNSSILSGTTASTSRTAADLYIGALNNNGAATSFTAKQIGCAFAGGALVGIEDDFYNAWNTYFTSL